MQNLDHWVHNILGPKLILGRGQSESEPKINLSLKVDPLGNGSRQGLDLVFVIAGDSGFLNITDL